MDLRNKFIELENRLKVLEIDINNNKIALDIAERVLEHNRCVPFIKEKLDILYREYINIKAQMI